MTEKLAFTIFGIILLLVNIGAFFVFVPLGILVLFLSIGFWLTFLGCFGILK